MRDRHQGRKNLIKVICLSRAYNLGNSNKFTVNIILKYNHFSYIHKFFLDDSNEI